MTLNAANAANRNQLQNSFGPEITPYEQVHQPPPEQGAEKTRGEASGGEAKRRRILGLPVLVFWIIFALLALALLGVGVGVGVAVGAGRRSGGSGSGGSSSGSSPRTTASDGRNSRGPSTSTSTSATRQTSTSTAPAPLATSGVHGLAANSCNFPVPKTRSTADGTKFMQHCFVDWPRDIDAADGNGKVLDINGSTVYTFEDCLEECIKYNREAAAVKQPCRAVSYVANLTEAFEVLGLGGNCWLKNKQGVDLPNRPDIASAAIAGK